MQTLPATRRVQAVTLAVRPVRQMKGQGAGRGAGQGVRPGQKCKLIQLIYPGWTPGEDEGDWDELAQGERAMAGGREARAGFACRGYDKGADAVCSFGQPEAGVWVPGMQGQAGHHQRSLPRYCHPSLA